MVIGYKGTDTNMTCKTFKYSLNQEYTMDKDNIIMCAIGFHFSPKLEDVFDYYFDKDSRFFEVEADECLEYNESDKKIVCAKIRLTKEIFPYDVSFPNHRELMLTLCTKTPYSLKWIPTETKTQEFLMEVLKSRPEAIEYITNPTSEMMLEAVKAYGPTILFLPKASDEIKMEAIKNHWYSIRHISSPSEALQFEAVYNDIDAIYFIDKPSQAVKDYVDGVKDGSIIPIPPGGVNYNGIYLNEICGADENSVDWVELYNTSNDIKDLSNVKLIKDGATDTAFVFPKNTVINPKEVISVSNANDGLFNISNSTAVKIELCKPNNEVLDTFNTTYIQNFVGHIVGGSYARIPDGTGAWEVQETHTIGERNAAIVIPPSEMIRLNEICGARE